MSILPSPLFIIIAIDSGMIVRIDVVYTAMKVVCRHTVTKLVFEQSRPTLIEVI